MRSIFKYPLIIADRQIVSMPHSAKILTVEVQDGLPTLWAQVIPDAIKQDRIIVLRATGEPIHDDEHMGDYIGTVLLLQGSAVLHVFEVPQ